MYACGDEVGCVVMCASLCPSRPAVRTNQHIVACTDESINQLSGQVVCYYRRRERNKEKNVNHVCHKHNKKKTKKICNNKSTSHGNWRTTINMAAGKREGEETLTVSGNRLREHSKGAVKSIPAPFNSIYFQHRISSDTEADSTRCPCPLGRGTVTKRGGSS